MIAADRMLPLLVEAAPGFAPALDAFREEWAAEGSRPPYYLALSEFAKHLSEVLKAGDIDTLRQVFAVIERLHLEGDAYVREAVTVGLLEDLQNLNLHAGTRPVQYNEYLLPETRRWWGKVERFWERGEIIADS